MVEPCIITALAPIWTSLEIITPPHTVEFGEIWTKFLTIQSCSIIDPELIILWLPTQTSALIIEFLPTKLPTPSFEFWLTIAVGSIIFGKIYPLLVIKSTNFLLTLVSPTLPNVIKA